MDWLIEGGGNYTIKGEKIFGRNIFVKAKDMLEIVSRFDNKDVYLTNYVYDSKDQNNSNIIGPLYIDLDINMTSEEDFNKVKMDTLLALAFIKTHLHVPPEYIRLYFSSNKGFHIFIPYNVFGLEPCKDLNVKFKAIATTIKKNTLYGCVDTSIYDKKRLIRVPHSLNSKSGLYKVPLTESMLKKFNYKDIIEYASTDREIDIISTKLVLNSKIAFEELTKIEEKPKKSRNGLTINPNFKIPICIKNIFHEGCSEGSRNNTLVVIASSILQSGKDLDDTIDLLKGWNEDKNIPPLGEMEVENTIRSAYRSLLDGRKYGCASLKELGLCLGTKCKIYRE